MPKWARNSAWVAFDGHDRTELKRGDTLCVRVSPFPVPAVCHGTENEDWFTAVTGAPNPILYSLKFRP